MKKICLFFTIFLVLIAISSFSWALTESNVNLMSVDLTDCNSWFTNSSYSTFDVYTALSNLGFSDSDILLYTSCIVSKGTYNNQNCVNVLLARAPFYMNSQYTFLISEGRYSVVLYIGTDNSQIGYLKLGDQTTSSRIFNDSYLFANYLYSDSSLSTAFSLTQYYSNCNFFNTTFFNNSFNFTGTISPSREYFEPTLMIDDMNFKKSFKFTFEIEQIREDTKYYIFLKDYTRNNYSSVTADFIVLSVTTPNEYDYSKYYNYLYFDDYLDELNLPAGCEIHIYTGSGTNNFQVSLTEITLDNNNILPHYNLGTLTNLYYNDVNTSQLFSTFTYNDLIPTSYNISSNSIGKVITSILNALEFKVNLNDNSSLSFNVIDTFLPFLNNSTLTSEEFRKSYYLQALYYGIDKYTSNSDFNNAMSIIKNYNNFICGNYSIISYENSKFDSAFGVPYYELYRSTKIYDCENQVNTNFYRFQYTDKEDVSSMLPSGVSVDYLTSPFYQQNNNSSSGGYITYNITEILYGDNPINYSINESPLRINPQEDYISNSDDTDNQVLNDNTTEQIDNTSSDNFLKGIYQAVLKIQDILSKQSIQNQNNITNITYNIEQNFKYFFIPQDRFF